MSYILDALRKADAERERDPARGIHAQPMRGPLAQGAAAPRYGPWLWTAVAGGVAAFGAASWYLYHDRAAIKPVPAIATAPPPVRAMPGAPIVPTPAPVVGTTMLPAPVVASAAVPAAAIEPPAPPPTRVRSALAGGSDPRAASVPPMRGAAQTSATAQLAQVAPPGQSLPQGGAFPQPVPGAGSPMTVPPMPQPGFGPGAPAGMAAPGNSQQSPAAPMTAPAPAPAPPINPPPPPPVPPPVLPPAPPTPPVAGLPADAPKLAISGGVFSTSRAQRMLIVNGQVFNEGSEVGPGVVLEEVRSKSAVLRFRGARYTVSY